MLETLYFNHSQSTQVKYKVVLQSSIQSSFVKYKVVHKITCQNTNISIVKNNVKEPKFN